MKDSVATIIDRLTKELCKQYEAGSGIKREGTQIVVPEFMSLKDASKAITDYEASQETKVQKNIIVIGHPSDTLNAYYMAMTLMFGQVNGSEMMTFFGLMPSQAVTIQVGCDEFITVPVGRINLPGIPVQMNVSVNREENTMESALVIGCTYLKKYQPIIEEIERRIKDYLLKNPIFKGKAIDSRWSFLPLNGFDTKKIVYSEQEYADLNAHIFMNIEKRAVVESQGLPLKRTVLLHGRYGTGKTLTALLTGKKCVENGWTFINVLPGDDITTALKFAVKYQPALVFFEDIDQVTNQDRDSLNVILNTVDGLLSKSSKVMTVMTTNNVERIEKAMLRPGRIDAVLSIGTVDESSIGRLVETRVKVADLDPSALMKVAEGYTPAFVVEAGQRALLYAMSRGSESVTNNDIINALVGLRSQYELMIGEKKEKAITIDSLIKGHVSTVTEKVAEDTNKIVKYLGA